MMFWHEVDGALLRESAKMAGPIRDSIRAQVDIDEIIRQWNLSYPKGAEVTTAEARAWAKVQIKVDNTELNKGLGILYAIGWLFGKDVATSAYAHAKLNKAAPTDEALNSLLNIDWDNWVPGMNPGALLAAPPGGLKGLLQRRGLDLQGLTNTLLNRIGTHLADALMSGASDTMLGKVLETVVGDPERALTIANTSMASAMSVSTRETYQEFGLAKMRWLALEPCNTCAGNGALGPVTPGEAVFKNVQGDNITEPPAHPNCRCALSPYIDLDQFKFSNSQARDAHGRWTSGGVGTPSQTPASIKAKSLKTIEDINTLIGPSGQLAVSDGRNTQVLQTMDPNGDPNKIAAQLNNTNVQMILANKYEAEGMPLSEATRLAIADTGRAQMYFGALSEQKFNESLLKDLSPEERAVYQKNYDAGKKRLNTLVQEGQVTVAVRTGNFEQVLKDGEFKNQFETKTSGGTLSENYRRDWESASLDVPMNTKGADRPIYGYMTDNASNGSDLSWNGISSINSVQVNQYGDLRVVMKSDVRSRTTYMVGDSLSRQGFAYSVDSPMTDDILTTNGFSTLGASVGFSGNVSASYVETQIHGGLKVTDIAKVYAPASKVEQVKTLIKNNGLDIPVEAKE